MNTWWSIITSYQKPWFYFSEQNYSEAIVLYTQAIQLNPLAAVFYANRAFAYIKTECFGYALNDASKALDLDKSYVKVRKDIYFYLTNC